MELMVSKSNINNWTMPSIAAFYYQSLKGSQRYQNHQLEVSASKTEGLQHDYNPNAMMFLGKLE